MRHKKYTLKASDVHARAREILLSELDVESYRAALPAGLVVSLLLLAGAWQASLSAACAMTADPPCRELVRRAAHALLPRKPRELRDALLAALRNGLPEWLLAVPLPAAIDIHQRPFWGRRGTRGSTRGQRKAGASDFFAYATLAVLAPSGRFTVGLAQTRPKMRLTTLVGELLGQAAAAGVAISYLLMDKEFYAAEVIDLLQKRGVPFVVPAENRKAAARLFDPATPAGFYEYGWTADLKRRDAATGKRRKVGKLPVTVRGCVARHKKTGEPLAYATWGLAGWSPAQVASAYRRRFGIEACYRQLNACLARTSSRCERYRLLLVGVALLLCNLWAYLHSEVFGEGPRDERRPNLAAARLPVLCAALAAVVACLFGGYAYEWAAQRPLPDGFTSAA